MKLDRHINGDGLGKYAVINMRKLSLCETSDSPFHRWTPAIEDALRVLEEAGALEWGRVGEQDEFFLVKLKDINAPGALTGYAYAAAATDKEWAEEVRSMLPRAGANNPFCKAPD